MASISTDKSSVGGLGSGMQNVVIGLGYSNIGGLATPQVP